MKIYSKPSISFVLINALIGGILIFPIIAHPFLAQGFARNYLAGLVGSIFWVILILQSCLGIGLVFHRLLKPELSNYGVLGCLGLSILIFIGSILNILHFANREVLVFVVYSFAVVFIAYQLFKIFHRRGNIHSIGLKVYIALMAVALVLLANCSLSAMNLSFNIHDDYHGYLVFPTKLLDMGYLGADPFSERRVVTGLVGGPFLLALGLAGMPWNFIHILDVGLGLSLLTLVALFFPTGPGRVAFASKIVLLFGIACLQSPGVNLTATFVPAVLAVASWILLIDCRGLRGSENQIGFREMAALAFLIFGLLTLKNTFVVYAALIVFSVALFRYTSINKNFRGLFIFLLKFGALLFFLLIPSMLDLYGAAGTYFYPILGKGVHASSYGNFASATDGFLVGPGFWVDLLKVIDPYRRTIVLLNIALIVFLPFVNCIISGVSRPKYFIFLIVFCCLSNIFCVGLLIGGYGSYRYIFPAAIASFVSGYLLLLQTIFGVKIQRILLIIALLFSANSVLKFIPVAMSIYDKREFSIDAPISLERYSSYESLSKALPIKGGILARLDLPFLLPYSRRNIFLADYPGSASPSPGMPFRQGPELLVKYLQEQNIDYLVWDYGNQANFPIESYGDRLDSLTHPWIRSEAEHAFDFQLNLEKLRKTRPVIYDAHGFAIIDIRDQ